MGGVKLNGLFHYSIEEEFLNTSLNHQDVFIIYIFITKNKYKEYLMIKLMEGYHTILGWNPFQVNIGV